MDEMDIEQIPDTPERKSAQHIAGLQFEKESNAFADHAKNADFLREECVNQWRSSDKYVLDNGHNRKGPLHFRRRQPINVDEIEPRNNSVAFSSSGNSCTTAGGSLFRRASYDTFKHGAMRGIGVHAIDKGKGVQNKNPSDLPVGLGNNDIFDLTRQDEHKQMHGTVSPLVGLNSLQIRRTTEDVTAESGSSRHLPPTSISSNAFKGKEKIGVSCDVSGSAVDQGKKIHPFSGSHSPVTSPRVTGQKRLVRNGYISPHNIASRAQKLAESLRASSTTADKNHVANVSDGPSHTDIREIVAEDCSYNRAKGKRVVNHPSKPKERDAQNIHVSTSSVNGVANQMREAGKDEMLNGWRRTHNHVKKPNETSNNVVDVCLLERDDGVRNSVSEQHENSMAKTDCERINIARVESSLDKLNGRSSGASKLSKRQRKHELTSRNHGECSTMAPDDSEIIFLGSSREPSSSRSSRNRSFQPERNLYPIYEIDEPSHDMENNSQDSDYMNTDDSDTRARQLEADEMFARELQEQLYNETPLFDEHQIDENVAWALQQMDDSLPAAYSQNRPVSRPRSSATVHSNRQPRTRSLTNPSSRRGASARGPNNRSQLRNRVFNQSPTAVSRVRNHFPASRGRRFHFPLEMDLDMRLDILEALEAAVGDFSDMSMNTDHMLQVQRDFNENDYEMLLALDDNNHQRGASVNQINGLPESVVQADNFEEACAICLETPTRGETVRHLPCLHKFHKDCIDPWLRRKTSCPVCKSSIT